MNPSIFGYLLFTAALTVLLNAIAIAMVRVWNPSREVRVGALVKATDGMDVNDSEEARDAHVDSQLRQRGKGASREVWDNPILWREACTWPMAEK